MAISRHNGVTFSASPGSGSFVGSLSAAVGEIIVVQINSENVSGAAPVVSSISDGVNTYTRHFSATQTGASEPRFGASEGFEVWWAYVATALVAGPITVNFSPSLGDDTVAIIAGYQGFTGTAYQTNPWDTNASLPKTAQGTSGTTAATASGISTTSTAGMLLAGAGTVSDAQAFPPAPSGFSQAGTLINSAGTNSVQGILWDEVYASAQSSITVTAGTATTGWIFWVDALTDQGGGAVVAGLGGSAPLFALTLGPARRPLNFRPSLAQSSAATLSASIAEAGTATETESVIATWAASRTEAGTATEAETVTAVFAVSATEAATATETETAGTATPASITEAATASETESVAAVFASAVVEAGTATEAESVTAVFAASITEGASATDTSATGFSDGVTETASATEAETASVVFAVAIAEAGTATDTPNGVAVFSASASEAATASDAETSAAVFAASITEAGSAADVSNGATGGQIVNDGITEAGSATDTQSAAIVFKPAFVTDGYSRKKRKEVRAEVKAARHERKKGAERLAEIPPQPIGEPILLEEGGLSFADMQYILRHREQLKNNEAAIALLLLLP